MRQGKYIILYTFIASINWSCTTYNNSLEITLTKAYFFKNENKKIVDRNNSLVLIIRISNKTLSIDSFEITPMDSRKSYFALIEGSDSIDLDYFGFNSNYNVTFHNGYIVLPPNSEALVTLSTLGFLFNNTERFSNLFEPPKVAYSIKNTELIIINDGDYVFKTCSLDRFTYNVNKPLAMCE